ncbi:MAG TPA: MgtC/SapB family protein [Candidatus Paceibacterota bacterium]|jgi:putative Mg2+ transporter-C (MgtC) family protein|nr:MgtC/SapB family protein [Candidatus Paceibacterota bacterium]
MHLWPSVDIGTSIQIALVWRLLVAAVLGALLGLERSLAGKHAGMRTYALVSMGSALFVMTGVLASYQLSSFTGINPLQVAANVVLGVGFLGTGLAMFHGEHPVELTTAAGLWVAAGIGMTTGFGFELLALGGAVLALLILTLLNPFENIMRTKYGTEER